MSRSLKKGPYIDERLQKKVATDDPNSGSVINTWARGAVVTPEMVGHRLGVHDGRTHIVVRVSEEMVGHKLGEFAPTRKFVKHGGKLQKTVDQKTAK